MRIKEDIRKSEVPDEGGKAQDARVLHNINLSGLKVGIGELLNISEHYGVLNAEIGLSNTSLPEVQ